MKRYGSVFALAARASFTKIVAVTLLAAILCAVLLWFAPAQVTYDTYDENGHMIATTTSDTVSADMMVRKSFCVIPAALGFAAVVILLARIGTGKGVRPGYTVMRLRVKPWAVTALWSLYNCIMVLFYRAMIVLATYGVICYRIRDVGKQALLLASYGNSFLHNLLPLRDVTAWLLLVFLALLVGVGCAMNAAQYWQENSKTGTAAYVGISFTGICMNIPMGSIAAYIFIFASIAIIGIQIYQAFGGDEDETAQ